MTASDNNTKKSKELLLSLISINLALLEAKWPHSSRYIECPLHR
jgi:hypothetical protein